MATIIIKNWRERLHKLSLTKLQTDILAKSLKEAKENVDLLLDGVEVRIEINNILAAREFIDKANQIGANCILET